jgi:hypothetical protein
MTLATPINDLEGHQMIARGNAPGNCAEDFRALKGRNKGLRFLVGEFCVALSGLDCFRCAGPRALPRAIIFRPFGAERARGRTNRLPGNEEVLA